MSQPTVLWAQRSDQVFVTIDVTGVKDEKISLEPTKLTFSGRSGTTNYQTTLEFLHEIDPEKSKFVVQARGAEFVLHKKESGPYWERLLKEAGKVRWLKADWNKWKDEGEEEDEQAGGFDTSGMGNFDMSKMDFGNMANDFAADDDEDSDDDELPELEEDKKKEEAPKADA
eukprot:TRINITY_DN4252_c0_g1_i1.p2 TRINITY_DN4252_c0_g1~~TRINITY_DN4252_c0_g1_i1.p2  ORF type:complete len:171 (-),score=70.61 TRINITY_DN4252_c0_g1_i1:255-767(-)